ncbi:MAM and LDL-receptor class A domain-containing protein 1 [Arapaima gigas]
MTPSRLALCALGFLVTTAVGGQNCGPGDPDCSSGGHHEPRDTACNFQDHQGGSSNQSGYFGLNGCDFEEGLCSFSNSNDTPTAWTRGTGLTTAGPSLDHSGERTGHYLSLSGRSGTQALAALRSVVFLPTNSCQMTFYLHFGRVNGTLQVLTETRAAGPLQVWSRSRSGLQSQEEALWARATVSLHSTQRFQVILQGELYSVSTPTEVLAIDDIRFDEGCVTVTAGCCGFESGLCGWRSGTTQKSVGWRRVKLEDVSFSGGSPAVDHSEGSKHGHYLWMDGGTRGSAAVAHLESPTFHTLGSACTLLFHYSLGGSSELRVWLRTPGGNQILFNTDQATGDMWVGANVSLPGLEEFQVIFEGHADGGTAFVALDSVHFAVCSQLTLGSPAFCGGCGLTIPATCSFESGWCHWELLGSRDTSWKRVDRPSNDYPEAPSTDHTLSRGNGSFAFAGGSAIRPVMADLGSPILSGVPEATTPCKLRFWYQLSEGAELGIFSRTTLGGELTQLASICEPTGTAWQQVEFDVQPVDMKEESPFQLVLRASLNGTRAIVALDDIDLSPACSLANMSLPGYSFSLGLLLSFSDCGPIMLLTTDPCPLPVSMDPEGQVRVTRASEGQAVIFALLTPGLDQGLDGSTSLQCAANGSLYLRHPASGIGPVSVGEVTGADAATASFWVSRDKWITGSITLEAVALPGHYMHRMGGSVWVAKDDGSPSFRESASWRMTPAPPPPPPCPPCLFQCSTGECISTDKVCDFTAHCAGGEDEAHCPEYCDFEQNSCGWHEFAPGDGFDWVRNSAAAVHPEFRDQTPPRDHTRNSTEGGFIFLQKTRNSLSQKAILRSPKYSQAGPGCTVTFWHYNSGYSVGAADLNLLIDGMDNVTVLWQTLYNQGDRWHYVTVQLGRIIWPFQLSLAKFSLAFFDGISALDDVIFHNCSLPLPEDECLGADRFHCNRSRACIARSLLCDLVDDCGDGSDEEGCSPDLQCSFEEGLCSWTQDAEGDVFDWTRIQGPTPTPNTGPWKDHTLGHVNGHYLFIEASSPQEFMDTAVLVSRGFQPTTRSRSPRPDGRDCVFRFNYHMYGRHIFLLAVYLRTTASGLGQKLWARYGDQGNLWHRQELVLTSSQPFQILVQGMVGDDFNGDIAIDDLSFLDCLPYDGEFPSASSTRPPVTTVPSTDPPHTCPDGQMACDAAGYCVDLSKRCDFLHDCPDGTDELDCGGCQFNPLLSEHLHCLSDLNLKFASLPIVKERCDFEGGDTCGWYRSWTNGSLHVFRWDAGQGQSIHHGEEFHRPAKDHTQGTPEGWYMYADSSNGGYRQTSDLLTPIISRTGPRCTLVFWYHMSGFTVGTLQVLGKFGNKTHELWSQSGTQAYRWKRGEVFLGIQYNFQVILRAKRGISYLGDVVVDDISFQDCAPPQAPTGPCAPEEFACTNSYCIPAEHLCDFINDCGDWSDENAYICRAFNGRCNFEFDLCSWQQGRRDNFNWLTKEGGTSIGGTGPSTDHTLRDPLGHYIYLKSSFPQEEGDIARIISPVFSFRSRQCKVVFYLHMSGDGVGTLSILLETAPKNQQLLLNLKGDQGHYWQRHEIQLSSTKDFQLVFEGKVGNTAKGDICLDDIVFTRGCLLSSSLGLLEDILLPSSGSCPRGYLDCANGHCFQPEQRCDFVDNCGDGSDEAGCGTSCTFESGRCGWKNSLADSFDWSLGTGSAQSFQPPVDHTLQTENGHFVYLQATPVGLRGDKAHMKSDVWKESSSTCKLTFWYYLSPHAMGIVRLLVRTSSGISEVWNATGNQGVHWNQAEVLLRKMRNFELIFEGVRVKDMSGGAALDDLEFSNCAPRVVLPGSCPSINDFVCQNGDCIESHLVCDNKADCVDESDELDCRHILDLPGTCNFNMPDSLSWEDICQLSQNTDDDFNWKVGHTRKTLHTGPSADHSPDGRGKFLYIHSAVQKEGDVARITTRTPFPASIGVCHLRFWYYMFGSHQMGTLKVYTVGAAGTDLLMWATSGNHGNRWTYASVVLSNNKDFRVAIEAEVGGDMWTDIAVDDISFTVECTTAAPVTAKPKTCQPDSFQCLHDFQCIPRSWQCDGEIDCADLSDEEQCPTRHPGTVPPQDHCGQGRYQCRDGRCLATLLRCDGVPDCSHGEDEFDCPLWRCSGGSLVCETTIGCIPPQYRCDGTAHCLPFLPDESSCQECPLGYCMNGGTCHLKKLGPLCRCAPGWVGNRCHVREKPKPPVSSTGPVGSRPDPVFASLVVGLVLLVGGAVAVIILLYNRKLRLSSESDGMDVGIMGTSKRQLFSHKLPRIDVAPISVYPWKSNIEVQKVSWTDAPLSFANPLYPFPRGATEFDDRSSEA